MPKLSQTPMGNKGYPQVAADDLASRNVVFSIVGASKFTHPKFGETVVLTVESPMLDTKRSLFMSATTDTRKQIYQYFQSGNVEPITDVMIVKLQTKSGQPFYDLASPDDEQNEDVNDIPF